MQVTSGQQASTATLLYQFVRLKLNMVESVFCSFQSFEDSKTQRVFLFWTLTFLKATAVCSFEISSCPRNGYTPSSMLSERSDVSQSSNLQGNSQETRATPNVVTSDSTALAVVLYKEENLLPHEKKNRSFNIAGQEFHIEQDWHVGGVAAVVWDAALVLGEYLASNPHLVQDKQVLELGAGTGLAGMVASSLGADVIVTEREEALSFLETAISTNKVGKNWRVKAEVLDWTHRIDISKWSHFDLVIGADIVYIESTFPHLLRTIKSVAASSKTQVLLSCRIRYDRDLRFLHMLRKFYSVEEIFYNSELDIKIFLAISKS